MSMDQDISRGCRAMLSLGRDYVRSIIPEETCNALYEIFKPAPPPSGEVRIVHIRDGTRKVSSDAHRSSLCSSSSNAEPYDSTLLSDNERWCPTCLDVRGSRKRIRL